MKRYRILGGHCKICSLRSTCLPGSQKNRARFVYRSLHQSHIDKVRRRQSTRLFKIKLTERVWKIEGLFGEAKDNHCLRRTKCRGMVNVQIQFYLTALTQNLKRMAAVKPFLCELAIRITNMASWKAVQGFLVKIDNFYIEYLPKTVVRYGH
ncbi:MAG: transposase [Gammaproteobacteria bacterium]|nr:transposase [Gammaproteobacteria bacterium]